MGWADASPRRPTTAPSPPPHRYLSNQQPSCRLPRPVTPTRRRPRVPAQRDSRGGAPGGCVWASADVARSPGVSNAVGSFGRKKIRERRPIAWQRGLARRSGSAPVWLERSPGPAIGSRVLSLAAAASGQGPCGDWFRPGAKCNAGKTGAGTPAAGCYFRGLGAARPASLSSQRQAARCFPQLQPALESTNSGERV